MRVLTIPFWTAPAVQERTSKSRRAAKTSSIALSAQLRRANSIPARAIPRRRDGCLARDLLNSRDFCARSALCNLSVAPSCFDFTALASLAYQRSPPSASRTDCKTVPIRTIDALPRSCGACLSGFGIVSSARRRHRETARVLACHATIPAPNTPPAEAKLSTSRRTLACK